MTFKPIGREILFEYIEDTAAHSGLELPEGATRNDLSIFVVVAVGQGYLTNKGWIDHVVKVGDRIQLKPSAKGAIYKLPKQFLDDEERELATIDIDHVAGVWEGDMPAPKIKRPVRAVKGDLSIVH